MRRSVGTHTNAPFTRSVLADEEEGGMKSSTKKLLLATVLVAVLADCQSAGSAQPALAKSLCRAREPVLFICDVGNKTVSICGGEQGGAAYRYGRPNRVELEIKDLHLAYKGWSGGGETQVYADTPTYRYIVYDRMVRTGFGSDGHNDPKETVGLLVQDGRRTVSSRECALPKTFDEQTAVFDQRLAETLVPEGQYVDR